MTRTSSNRRLLPKGKKTTRAAARLSLEGLDATSTAARATPSSAPRWVRSGGSSKSAGRGGRRSHGADRDTPESSYPVGGQVCLVPTSTVELFVLEFLYPERNHDNTKLDVEI
jgi:hypothetical protein